MCRKAVCAKGRAGIESEPAEPQKSCAERDEGHVVAAVTGGLDVFPFPEGDAQKKRGDTGGDMDDVASRKVGDTDAFEPSAVSLRLGLYSCSLSIAFSSFSVSASIVEGKGDNYKA